MHLIPTLQGDPQLRSSKIATTILCVDICLAPVDRRVLILLLYQALDHLGIAQLINYIRSEVDRGVENPRPVEDGKLIFKDSRYLLPTLKDDAVLYSLDDIFGECIDPEEPCLDLLENRWNSSEGSELSSKPVETLHAVRDQDGDYFASYSYTGKP